MACRFFHRVFARIAVLLCCGVAWAGQPEPPPTPEPPAPPPLVPTIQVRGAERPVRLKTLDIAIAIRAGYAEIGLDMVFFNPNNRILEGELQFPLLPGQEISGIALDIQGEMRPGVPVPKARGQEIFEDIARRNVDPALLEATRGNMYRLRVYPIPANGARRVAVRVMQPLTARDGMYSLRLPLNFAKHLDALGVEAVVAATEPPKVESGSLGLVLEQAGLLYKGKANASDIAPEGWLVISLPAKDEAAGNADVVRWKDKIYFAATGSVEMRTQKRALPDVVTIVWDASGSGGKRDHGREYDLLDAYFAAFGDGAARLVVVRNVAEPAKEFAVRGGDWSELKAYLHALPYDGGTNLAAWKPTGDCAEYLLFTDGLANFGGGRRDDPLPAMGTGRRLYAVTASLEADHALLRHASGGRLVDLMRCDTGAAAKLLLEDRTTVRLAAEDLAGKGEARLDPLAADSGEGSDRHGYRLAGWFAPRSGMAAETVVLHVEHPDGAGEAVRVAVPLDQAETHTDDSAPLAARLWGRYAIAELEANADRHRAAILRLGEELGIVSRETSLIVLETAEDYARYDVAPPASLRDEVERLRSRDLKAGGGEAYLPMARLERMWRDKVAWWKKDFAKKPKKEKPAAPVHDEESGSAESLSPSLRQHAPRPAATPAFEAEARYAPQGMRERRSLMADAYMAAPAAASQSVSPREEPAARPVAGIALQAWRADAPYIRRMNEAKKDELYAIYLDERPGYERSSAFYFDMADRLFNAGLPELGLRVLSNLAEIEIENRQLLRMLAYRLLEAGEPGLALGVFETVRELAPNEPQSLRDLAVAHIALGDRRKAADLLYEVAKRKWDGRFADVNVIALTELNALVATAGDELDAAAFDRKLIKNLASDLRVVLAWDTDNTDMDLWVTDPDGEKCDYSNRLTALGGAMSSDCTGGYGPEEFMLRKAKPGIYRVEVEYYGSGQQILSGETTLYVTLTTGFGTAGQEDRVITMRLKSEKSRVFVGEFTME